MKRMKETIDKNSIFQFIQDDATELIAIEEVKNSWKNSVLLKSSETDIQGLRPAQLGALFSVKAHWTVSNKPATIVMPTGTGKTETMIATVVSEQIDTYNDAIRRTVGSYVLYPGDFDSKTKNYRLFEEVLPGVRAFAIKPSIQADSENALKDFISEIIEARSRKYSRLNRMLSYSNLVLGEPAISTLDKRTSGKDKDNKNIHSDLCVIWECELKKDFIKTMEWLEQEIKCHDIEGSLR